MSNPWKSGAAFEIGPFVVTPLLIDHSAFDAYMLLIEVQGKAYPLFRRFPEPRSQIDPDTKTDGYAIRRVTAMRFLTFLVPLQSTFPPLMSLSGQSPIHELNAPALRNFETSPPNSADALYMQDADARNGRQIDAKNSVSFLA